MTISKPSVSGFWNSGVAQVLSITVVMLCALASAVMAVRSTTFMVMVPGDSV
ncbi:hypothetical protein D3C80_2106400 [compost metagenome]